MQAIKISLEVKKYLVDSERLDISQVHLFAAEHRAHLVPHVLPPTVLIRDSVSDCLLHETVF